jgi:hypothetical protein
MNSTDTESAEEADSEEPLDFDENQYPQLPDNVLELRLHRQKAILRLFMAAASTERQGIHAIFVRTVGDT